MSYPGFTPSKMGANTNQDGVCMQESKVVESGKSGVYAIKTAQE
jgi:hypothetical protein